MKSFNPKYKIKVKHSHNFILLFGLCVFVIILGFSYYLSNKIEDPMNYLEGQWLLVDKYGHETPLEIHEDSITTQGLTIPVKFMDDIDLDYVVEASSEFQNFTIDKRHTPYILTVFDKDNDDVPAKVYELHQQFITKHITQN